MNNNTESIIGEEKTDVPYFGNVWTSKDSAVLDLEADEFEKEVDCGEVGGLI
jgi:hypothetical protein